MVPKWSPGLVASPSKRKCPKYQTVLFFLAKESDDHDMVKSWVPSISEHPYWLVVWNTAAIAQVPSRGVADFTERWAGV